MTEIGINVNKAKTKDGKVHVYKYGAEDSLCGLKLKPVRVAMPKDEAATCRLCWGQLYLHMSLEIDTVFDYPTPGELEAVEGASAA